MQIENIYIKNFKGLEEVDVDVAGKSIYLVGGNATGKTSFIDAIWCGLTGQNMPEAPITKGNKKAEIRIDLGSFVAVTEFTKNKPTKFSLENKEADEEGEKFIKAPRTYLNNRIGILDFDINAFFAKSAAEQVKCFAKISGIDFGDIDEEIEELEAGRLVDGRKLKEAKAKVTYYDKKLVDKEIVSVVEKSRELEAAKEKQKTYREGEDAHGTVSTEIIEARNKILELYVTMYGDNDATVIVNFPDTAIGGNIAKQKAIKEWLDAPENQPLSSEQMAALNDSFNTLETENENIRLAKEGKEIDDEVVKLEASVEKYTEDIVTAKTKKAKRISENITVEGLAYDMELEGFLYNGLPFDKNQINTAAQLIAGLKIGAMLLKDLKILKVDASLIDKVEFDKVLAWAEENNIELFIELVDREASELQLIVHEQ